MNGITTIIIARNEESHIADAVRSATGLGIVLVVDAESTDRTREIAHAAGAKIIVNHWPGFAAQRRFAISHTETEWILFLDADERVTLDLASEIARLEPKADGYFIGRRNQFLGGWMNHGAWGRDRVLRLFRKSKGSVPDRLVHEEVRVIGPTERLDEHLLHYAQNDFATIGRKFAAYLPLMAQEIVQKRRGRSIWTLEIATRAFWSFVRDAFLRFGILDGWRGFVLAFWGAASVVAKYAEAKRIQEHDRAMEEKEI